MSKKTDKHGFFKKSCFQIFQQLREDIIIVKRVQSFLKIAVAATFVSGSIVLAEIPINGINSQTSNHQPIGFSRPNITISPRANLVETSGFFKIADSAKNGYSYGYAPSIIKHNGIYHTFYCSSPEPRAGIDAIRYVFSKDGLNWSAPKVVLKAKPRIESKTRKLTNRAACDPSLVYYQDYYYLFYSNQYQTGSELGDRVTTQTAISVARARKIAGPYLTYTERGTWAENPADVKMIILPQFEHRDIRNNYGAGQQTVVVKNGQLYMWYTDDSLNPNEGPHIYLFKSNDPVNWTSIPVPTNLTKTSSVDIKYDIQSDRFVLVRILRSHSRDASLSTAYSIDGINWKGFRTLLTETKFPAFAHNVGISSDRQGHLIDE
ncbi:MAG: hypothetical protein WBL95_02740 [Microcoleus sp.]